MSVSLAFAVTLRPFASRPEPGMPLGLWAFFASTLGDAGGGILQTAVRFQNLGGPGNSLLYSLEQQAIQITLDGGIICAITMSNMDLLSLSGSTGARTDLRQVDLLDNGASLGSSLPIASMQHRPIFIGAPIQNGLNAGINWTVANSAVSLSVKAEGYYWSPGAINAIGGPQRPPGSIYGI